ncbi:MAG: thermonuclease family protein [Gammaproteobacteria bacterium]|nr:MAG: thermonuclease family protein [Gammaproteobacteria bacterium]
MTMKNDYRYFYDAIVKRIIDGDTIVADVDLGFGIWMRNQRIRFYGINAPEKSTYEGSRATAYVANRIPPETHIKLQTIKDRTGKYGRYLGIIWVDDTPLNEELVDQGLAEKYLK